MFQYTKGRRQFISKFALALAGTTFLSSHTYSLFNNVDSPFEGYDPKIGDKNDLRSHNSRGQGITVSGKVYSKNGVTVRPNAQIKVWHLSPESSKYNHMGAFSANESGAYAFKTDMPNRTTGKLPRIYFKISHGGNVVYTELIVDANRAYISHEHWENHKSLNDNLFPVYKKNLVETEIQFNVTV